jgi:hypothetical protein
MTFRAQFGYRALRAAAGGIYRFPDLNASYPHAASGERREAVYVRSAVLSGNKEGGAVNSRCTCH